MVALTNSIFGRMHVTPWKVFIMAKLFENVIPKNCNQLMDALGSQFPLRESLGESGSVNTTWWADDAEDESIIFADPEAGNVPSQIEAGLRRIAQVYIDAADRVARLAREPSMQVVENIYPVGNDLVLTPIQVEVSVVLICQGTDFYWHGDAMDELAAERMVTAINCGGNAFAARVAIPLVLPAADEVGTYLEEIFKAPDCQPIRVRLEIPKPETFDNPFAK